MRLPEDPVMLYSFINMKLSIILQRTDFGK